MANVKYGWLGKENPDLLAFYNSSNKMQQTYIDLRANGIDKALAYKRAGYKTTNPVQAACVLEKRVPSIKTMIQAIKDHKELYEKLSGKKNEEWLKEILEKTGESKELEILRQATADEATRIMFYTDIVQGKTTVKVTTKTKDENGELKVTKIEIKEPTIQDRINARKELDKILGLKETGNPDNKVYSGDDNSQTIFNFNVADTSSKDHEKQDYSIKDNDYIKAEIIEDGDEE